MKERFIMSQTSFTIKVVRKEGIRTVRQAVKPSGAFWFAINVILNEFFKNLNNHINLKFSLKINIDFLNRFFKSYSMIY